MFEIRDLVIAAIGVLAAIPAAYFSAKSQVTKMLTERLSAVSGGAVSTIEDLVAIALTDKRIREETPIAVYGPATLWSAVRKGNFMGATLSHRAGDCPVAIVDADSIGEEVIGSLTEPYILIYKQGAPYRGPLPPGALVTFANSDITLDARLIEALRHREARRSDQQRWSVLSSA